MSMTKIRLVGQDETNPNLYHSKKEGNHLCDLCGRNFLCRTQKKLQRMEGIRLQAIIIHGCSGFIPTIGFADMTGWRRDEVCNTIRTGSAWSRRLMKGTMIKMEHKSGLEMIGRVALSRAADKETVMRVDGSMNHMVHLDDTTNEGKLKKLTKILVNAYGPNRWRDAEELSAIYIRPLFVERAEIRKFLRDF